MEGQLYVPTSIKPTKPYLRLPRNVIPLNYKVVLNPDNLNPQLKGRMWVRVKIESNTNIIVINGVNILISKIEFITDIEDKCSPVNIISLANEDETIQIELEETLTPGLGVLYLEFTSEITENDTLKGFHRVKFTSPDGSYYYQYVTIFDADNARRCFPCWDEPDFKATFDIVLIVHNNYKAISNMWLDEEKSRALENENKLCVFGRTPRMSTCHLAFAIGCFEFLERTIDDIRVRIYTARGKRARGKVFLSFFPRVLRFYEDYFKFKYPLTKFDFVAFPHAKIGLMENLGLIVANEGHFLLNDTFTLEEKTDKFGRMANSLSTMWMGNIASFKWWSDSWLQRTLEDFLMSLCLQKIHPSCNDLDHTLLTLNLLPALESDAYFQFSQTVERPASFLFGSETDPIYNNLTYRKGLSLIGMLHQYIMDQMFCEGIQTYMYRFRYSNANSDEFWDALGSTSEVPVKRIMQRYTKQVGFPLVTVLRMQYDASKEAHKFTLKQEKFWIDGRFYAEEYADFNASFKWVIPITFTKRVQPKGTIYQSIFDGTVSNIFKVALKASQDDWIKINANFKGFYRVKYPSDILQGFVPAIENNTMEFADRLNLLDDLFATVRSGHSPLIDLLQFLLAFKNEVRLIIWKKIDEILCWFDNVLIRTFVGKKFRKYAAYIFKSVLNRYGWGERRGISVKGNTLRAIAYYNLAMFKDEEAITVGKLYKIKWFDIPQEVIHAVYTAHLSEGDDKVLDEFITKFRASKDPNVRQNILSSFGSVKDLSMLDRIFYFIISENLTCFEINLIITSVSALQSVEGQLSLWTFFKENIKFFKNKFAGFTCEFIHTVAVVSQKFVTDERATEVEDFFEKHFPSNYRIKRIAQQTVEKIRISASWLARAQDFDMIDAFLSSF